MALVHVHHRWLSWGHVSGDAAHCFEYEACAIRKLLYLPFHAQGMRIQKIDMLVYLSLLVAIKPAVVLLCEMRWLKSC
jgi:hypothetical protein